MKNRIVVSASTENLVTIRNFVAENARNCGILETTIDEIRLAVDEAFTNIIKHAYNFDDSKTIRLETNVKDKAFCITIYDKGKPYDPSSYAEPNIAERIKQGKRGGVGIYLMKKLMDRVEYSTSDSVNRIRLFKHL